MKSTIYNWSLFSFEKNKCNCGLHKQRKKNITDTNKKNCHRQNSERIHQGGIYQLRRAKVSLATRFFQKLAAIGQDARIHRTQINSKLDRHGNALLNIQEELLETVASCLALSNHHTWFSIKHTGPGRLGIDGDEWQVAQRTGGKKATCPDLQQCAAASLIFFPDVRN